MQTKNYIGEIDFIIDIMSVYNLRSAEVLRISCDDIISNKFVIVRGCKGSQNIVIRDRVFVSVFTSLKEEIKKGCVFSVTYNMLYYHIKQRFGAYTKKSEALTNKAVTHQFRYINSKTVANFQAKKLILNHKSNRNVRFYDV